MHYAPRHALHTLQHARRMGTFAPAALAQTQKSVSPYVRDIVLAGKADRLHSALQGIAGPYVSRFPVSNEPVAGRIDIGGESVRATLVPTVAQAQAQDQDQAQGSSVLDFADLRILVADGLADALDLRSLAAKNTIVCLGDDQEAALAERLRTQLFKEPVDIATKESLGDVVREKLAAVPPDAAEHDYIATLRSQKELDAILGKSYSQEVLARVDIFKKGLADEQKRALAGYDIQGPSAADKKAQRAAFTRFVHEEIPFRDILVNVDSVASRTRTFIQESFLRDLDLRLAFGAGLFRSLEGTTSRRVDDFLKQIQPVVTAELENEIAQAAEDAHGAALRGIDLVSYVQQRRDELCARGGPADVLEQGAQRLVSQTAAASVLSATAAVAAHLLGGLSVFASGGLGLLGVALALVSRQKAWTKRSAIFLRDMDREMDSLSDALAFKIRECSELAMKKGIVAVEKVSEQATGHPAPN